MRFKFYLVNIWQNFAKRLTMYHDLLVIAWIHSFVHSLIRLCDATKQSAFPSEAHIYIYILCKNPPNKQCTYSRTSGLILVSFVLFLSIPYFLCFVFFIFIAILSAVLCVSIFFGSSLCCNAKSFCVVCLSYTHRIKMPTLLSPFQLRPSISRAASVAIHDGVDYTKTNGKYDEYEYEMNV